MKIKLTFIGTSSCLPDTGAETACFLINDSVMVDTGWNGVWKMKTFGINPEKIRCLILTHMHQDHYIGLPQLLFYLAMSKSGGGPKTDKPLVIIGPAAHLEKIIGHARAFLQIDRFPELNLPLKPAPLAPGESYETKDFLLETMRGVHFCLPPSGRRVEEALICKLTDRAAGKKIVFTGDASGRQPGLDEFAAGARLLIHDTAHCSAADAASTAREAHVRSLCLIHSSRKDWKNKLKAAKAVFADTFVAQDGMSIKI